ncbi:AcrR family transcriptional regulator [Paenibacillus sp. JGP012]|uniref:TetR/AcrR family transcriptional regulator n=1 Tax=Paenibacillus sp. JGP012 TaxID=2735914 RepID=UPI0016171838|nr:TetR/AcrR family transcriptional regulator [Paenibacillus sp. JGP012]MBB6023767.1 AcrR family transcriptional regulator [Paenibacillus sp. JGP012]
MSKEKLDLRIVKTRKAITESFLELLQIKEYDRITVQDIADRAMINRNTFYLHYLDKPDLLDKLYSDYTNKLNVCADRKTDKYQEITKEILSEVLLDLFNVIDTHLMFFKPVLVQKGLPDFSFHLKMALKKFIFSDIMDLENKFHLQIEMEYIISGLAGVICFWILHSEDHIIEEMIAQICELHFDNLSNVLSKLG